MLVLLSYASVWRTVAFRGDLIAFLTNSLTTVIFFVQPIAFPIGAEDVFGIKATIMLVTIVELTIAAPNELPLPCCLYIVVVRLYV